MVNIEAPSTKFTSLQHELLKLYSRNVPEEDLIAIKQLIAGYFMDKLQHKVDKAVEDKGYNQQDFHSWLNEPNQ